MFDYGTPRPEALYAEARQRGRRSQRWSLFRRGAGRLLPLAELEAACIIHARRYAGVRDVPLAQIRGSESRCSDFDQAFHPVQDHSKARWLRVATARHQGKSLPPVELIQVGQEFFVRDGHHRISVAQAVGQMEIEAEVTVWDVSPRLRPEAPPHLSRAPGRARGRRPAAAVAT